MKRCLHIVLLAILLAGCAKEDDPQFTTVRRVLPIDGTYEGSFSLRCDSIGLNKLYSNRIITITSRSSEEVFIDNSLCNGHAYTDYEGLTYDYGQMHWIDFTDCNTETPVSFDFKGTGKLEGDTLKEVGWFIAYKNGKPYHGTWSSKSIKTN